METSKKASLPIIAKYQERVTVRKITSYKIVLMIAEGQWKK